MSYARFAEETPDGPSDVYMFATILKGEEVIECCACNLRHPDPYFDTPVKAIVHLFAHEIVGHNVPPRAFERLRAESEDGVFRG